MDIIYNNHLLNLPWHHAFVRRRQAWLSTHSPITQRPQHRILHLEDDVLSQIFQNLLPDTQIIQSRALTDYRDAISLALSSTRLYRLFHAARVQLRPSLVDAVYHQNFALPNAYLSGQPYFPPIADAFVFHFLLRDACPSLRVLMLPSLPPLQIRKLASQVVKNCPNLQILQLTDAASLDRQTCLDLVSSTIPTLNFLRPHATCVRALAVQTNRVTHSNFDDVSESFFVRITQHFRRLHPSIMPEAAKDCHTRLLFKTSKNSRHKSFFPLICDQLILHYDTHKHSDTPHVALIRATRDSTPETSVAINTSMLRHLDYFLKPPSSDGRFSSSIGIVMLDLGSITDLDLFMAATQRTKTRARYRVGATASLTHVRTAFTLGSEENCLKLCKCLLRLFSCNNKLTIFEVSRELVAFVHLSPVLLLLQRLKNIELLCLRHPKTSPLDQHMPVAMIGDNLFLDGLPHLMDRLQQNYSKLETVSMETCFPEYPFARRKELRPKIRTGLDRVISFSSQMGNVDVDRLRKQLTSWMARVDMAWHDMID